MSNLPVQVSFNNFDNIIDEYEYKQQQLINENLLCIALPDFIKRCEQIYFQCMEEDVPDFFAMQDFIEQMYSDLCWQLTHLEYEYLPYLNYQTYKRLQMQRTKALNDWMETTFYSYYSSIQHPLYDFYFEFLTKYKHTYTIELSAYEEHPFLELQLYFLYHKYLADATSPLIVFHDAQNVLLPILLEEGIGSYHNNTLLFYDIYEFEEDNEFLYLPEGGEQ